MCIRDSESFCKDSDSDSDAKDSDSNPEDSDSDFVDSTTSLLFYSSFGAVVVVLVHYSRNANENPFTVVYRN